MSQVKSQKSAKKRETEKKTLLQLFVREKKELKGKKFISIQCECCKVTHTMSINIAATHIELRTIDYTSTMELVVLKKVLLSSSGLLNCCLFLWCQFFFFFPLCVSSWSVCGALKRSLWTLTSDNFAFRVNCGIAKKNTSIFYNVTDERKKFNP